MIRRADVTAEARGWITTPWCHQGHTKGVGTDCAGLIGGVAVALGIVAPDWWQTEFARFAGYSRAPSGISLVTALDAFMARIDPGAAGEGDVLVMRFRRDPQHVGFLAPYVHGGLSLIHALNSGSVKAVVEHGLDDTWRSRLTHAYALPGVV